MHSVKLATGIPISRIALAWLLTRSFVTSVIIGAKTREQLIDDLAAVDVKLTPEQVAQLDAAGALPSEYPGWMIERQAKGRSPEPAVKSETRRAA